MEIIQQEGDYVSGITSFLRERGVAGSQPVVPSYISNIDDARITEAYIYKSNKHAPYYSLLVDENIEQEAISSIREDGWYLTSRVKDGRFGYICIEEFEQSDIEISYSDTADEEKGIKVGTRFVFMYYPDMVKDTPSYEFATTLQTRMGVPPESVHIDSYYRNKSTVILTQYEQEVTDPIEASNSFKQSYLYDFTTDVEPYIYPAQGITMARSYYKNSSGILVELNYYIGNYKQILIHIYDPFDYSGDPVYDAGVEYVKNCFGESTSILRYAYIPSFRGSLSVYIDIWLDETPSDFLVKLKEYAAFIPSRFVSCGEPELHTPLSGDYWEQDFECEGGIVSSIFSGMANNMPRVQVGFGYQSTFGA